VSTPAHVERLKQLARWLRYERGLSTRAIAAELRVSQSTAWAWTRER
jgi:orotate phosphoribosyltransferase-like protein